MAVEVFQFSLVHDDIMDDALAKRNMTVHEKWDVKQEFYRVMLC
jgi:geranylgeranyl pyrophosphate synthase